MHLGLSLFDAEDDTRVTNRGAVLGDSQASPACAAPDLQHATARSLPGGIYGNFAGLSKELPHAVPLLPALLIHPVSSIINLS